VDNFAKFETAKKRNPVGGEMQDDLCVGGLMR